MKLGNHYLTQDLPEASKEYWCSLDLLCIIMDDLNNGEIEKAKRLSTDLTLSLHELSKLRDKKKQAERLEQLVDRMNASGIHIELVRRAILD